MGFYDAFFGSEQSQYTAYAIVAAIIAICITILLTATDIPVSNRLLIVFFVIVSLIPSVFLTLFELTCIVTGGTEPNQWWCYAFAWILAAFIIIYCIFIVIISLISLFTYNNAIDNVKMQEDNNRLSPEVSNDYAKKIIQNDEIKTKQIEKFYQENEVTYNNPFNSLVGDTMLTESPEPSQPSQQSQQLNAYDAGHPANNNESFINSSDNYGTESGLKILGNTGNMNAAFNEVQKSMTQFFPKDTPETKAPEQLYPQKPNETQQPVSVSNPTSTASFSNYNGANDFEGLDPMANYSLYDNK